MYLGFGYLGPSITIKNVRQQTEWWDILLLAWLLKHCLVYVSKICDHSTLHMLIFLAEFNRYQNHLAKEAALINLSPTRGSNSSAKYPSGPCPVCRTGPHGYRADVLWRSHWSLGVPRHHLHVSCFHCGHFLSKNPWAWCEPIAALPLRELTTTTNPSCTWWRDVRATQQQNKWCPRGRGARGVTEGQGGSLGKALGWAEH